MDKTQLLFLHRETTKVFMKKLLYGECIFLWGRARTLSFVIPRTLVSSNVLHQRVCLGLFTMFNKIRAHRGEFLNAKADRWADGGRKDVDNVRWDGPISHPTFSWTDAGVEHRCSMNKTLQIRVHLKVAELQLPFHKNFTSEFLNREDNIKESDTLRIFRGSTAAA